MLDTFLIVRKVYYILIAIIGIPVNVMALVILSRGKCGLSTCTTLYLVAMAVADPLTIIFNVVLGRISYLYFPQTFLHVTPVCSVIVVLARAATGCSVWFTVTFTFDRFVAIGCPKLKAKYCTVKTAGVVLTTAGILLCLQKVPFYFTFEPAKVIGNVGWFCLQKPSCFTDPSWVAFNSLNTIISPLFPFVLILLLNALTVKHILVASRVRKGLRGQSKRENHIDPEMEKRRRSAILLFTISGNFILMWLVHLVHFLYYTIDGGDLTLQNDSEYILSQSGYMFVSLGCCTNTFIYVVTQSKFRDQFLNALKYPLSCN
ncbi:probable G-protein coupled receptor 139 [Narcine bancroftii]|uniref:probable G-protein coupled receptor 139 n=1 Tax=Narcine bancroftii TaxID=1343680 RepID=UPI0038321A6E